LPERQTICPAVQGDEKFNVVNKLLYPSASARFELKSAGEMVPVAGGAEDITVGAAVMVAGITEEMDLGEEDTEDVETGT
jgi:predicted ribosome-associated RNA-binding protein Tma20